MSARASDDGARSTSVAGLLTLKLVRPYQTVDAYLDKESWSVDRSGMLLIGQDPAEPKTVVRFQIALQTGETLFRGEGSVTEYVEPNGEEPGGLRVRFKRFDSKSKAFLKRLLKQKKNASASSDSETGATKALRAPAADTSSDLGPDDDTKPEPAEANDEQKTSSAADSDETADDQAQDEEAQSQEEASTRTGDSGRSGVRTRPVAAPENRDELLERLRERATNLKETNQDQSEQRRAS